MKFRAAVLVVLCLLTACASAPRRGYSLLREPAPAAPLDEAALLAQFELTPDEVGYLVYDADTRRIVASRNPQSLFLPASVEKVPTTIAALSVLGAGHRFATTLALRHGDLYLKGGGDPLLTGADLMELAGALKRRPPVTIRHFYYDASEYPERDRVHPMQDEDAVYNTSVGALSAEFNRLELNWHTDPKDRALEAFLIPSVGSARLELTQQRSDLPSFNFRADPHGDTWLLPPDLARDGKKDLPVHHAGLFTAELFAQLCAEQGLSLPAPEAGRLPKDALVIHQHWSASLSELVSRNLEWSNNLMAELFLLATARRLNAAAGEPAATVSAWWKKQLPQVPWNGFVVENGSGLSPAARLSPSQAVGMLQWADRHPFDGKTYLSLLPISGLKGTLHQRLNQPQTALRVWAKTGTMKFGSSLAGYFFSRQNRKHVFALFVSDLAQRKALDEAAPGSPTAEARVFRKLTESGEAWVDRSRRFQDALLTKWIQEN